jgi:regulator of protease activity HflC (stomatin/prohibitin superfamily)
MELEEILRTLTVSQIGVGLVIGGVFWFFFRYGFLGFYTVAADERAVKTSFGRAQRLNGQTTLDTPLAEVLREDEKRRYAYPQLRVIGPGLHFKWPWETVHKVSVSVRTVSMAHDPTSPSANHAGQVLEAVTKDQLNIGLSGQLRYRVTEQNLYAYLFGVKWPIAHVMGYFVCVLRQRIASFEAPKDDSTGVQISINDLRKNLRDLNEHMDQECISSAARYGISLDASLITGIDPPSDVEAALAAINTAHNHVSSEVSLAQAAADQKIVQSKRAVEIETLKAKAESEPLRALAAQLSALKSGGPGVLEAYLRNVRLSLFERAKSLVMEVKR